MAKLTTQERARKYIYKEVLDLLKSLEAQKIKTFTIENFPEILKNDSIGIALKESKGIAKGIATQQTLSIYYYVTPTAPSGCTWDSEESFYQLRKKVITALKPLLDSGEVKQSYVITGVKMLGQVACKREDFILMYSNI